MAISSNLNFTFSEPGKPSPVSSRSNLCSRVKDSVGIRYGLDGDLRINTATSYMEADMDDINI